MIFINPYKRTGQQCIVNQSNSDGCKAKKHNKRTLPCKEATPLIQLK